MFEKGIQRKAEKEEACERREGERDRCREKKLTRKRNNREKEKML